MSLRINHNIAALNGQMNMARNDMAVSSSMQKLSSGLRINKAADDAAGLIISEQMRAQLAGIDQATQNSEQAITMVQTAEGAMDEMNTMLSKARQLAVHAANVGVNGQSQLVADQTELDNIVGSITRIAQTTQFGTKKILDGSLSSASSNNALINGISLGSDFNTKLASGSISKGYYTVQVTQNAAVAYTDIALANAAADLITGATLAAMSGTEQFQKTFTLSIKGAQVTVLSGTTKNQFVQQLNGVGSSLGFTAMIATGAGGFYASLTGVATGGIAGNITLISDSYGSRQTFNVQFVSGATGAQAVTSTEKDGADIQATIYYTSGADGVVATTGNTSFSLTSGNGLRASLSGFTLNFESNVSSGTVLAGAIDATKGGATFQIGANAGQTATVAMGSMQSQDIGKGASSTYTSLAALVGGALVSGNATEALKVIDQAISDVTSTRGVLGAFQADTLQTNKNSLDVAYQNLTAAESTIRDVNFAAESATFTKNNILMQASTAMLAQANQLPQGVLKLIG